MRQSLQRFGAFMRAGAAVFLLMVAALSAQAEPIRPHPAATKIAKAAKVTKTAAVTKVAKPAKVVRPKAVRPAKASLGAIPLPTKRPGTTEKAPVLASTLFSAAALPSAGHSMAIGYYPRGCLQGGVELPIDGPTWQVMRLERNRNWGHPELVRFLERFAPLAAKATGWHGILVGDMAQPRGGPLPFGHLSHQIGLDVDIWFMPMPARRFTTDERNTISASNLVAADGKDVNENWTAADAAFIRTAAEQPEVERVLVNAAIKKRMCAMQGKMHPAWMDKVRPWYFHNDHMHVRLKCPVDSPHCRAQPPAPASAQCGHELDYWFKPGVVHPAPHKIVPGHGLTLASLPTACKDVLNAPPGKGSLTAKQ